MDDLGERLKKRLATGWTENKVRALTNEAILERLAGFGIVTPCRDPTGGIIGPTGKQRLAV